MVNMPDLSRVGRIVKWAALIILALIIIPRFLVVIPAGTTGVYHLFGRVSDKPLSSGLHFVIPLAVVTKMSIQTQDYTMSIVKEEGRRLGDDSIDALTKEGLNVALDITVLFKLREESSPSVFRELGVNYQEIIIRPETRSIIREVVAQYDAKSLYSEKRGEAVEAIKNGLKDKIEPRGIIVEEVLLRNVKLPDRLAKSIEEKLQAEQESARYDFVLEKEKKEADRKRIEAQGQRDAQKTISESLTSSYLEYLYLTGLKDRQGTIYVPTNPANGLPLFRDTR